MGISRDGAEFGDRCVAVVGGVVLAIGAAGCGGESESGVDLRDDGSDGRQIELPVRAKSGQHAQLGFEMDMDIGLMGKRRSVGFEFDADAEVAESKTDGSYTMDTRVSGSSLTNSESKMDEVAETVGNLEGIRYRQSIQPDGRVSDTSVRNESELNSSQQDLAEDMAEASPNSSLRYPKSELGIGAEWDSAIETERNGVTMTSWGHRVSAPAKMVL